MVGKHNWSIIIMALTTVFIHSYLEPVAAGATTYYVAPTGTDSNPCSQPQPCQTIGHGIAVAAGPGNTLYVEAGSYSESDTVTQGGSSGSPFAIQGFAPGNSCPTTSTDADAYTPMNGGLHPAPTAAIEGNFTINASYVTFDCFEVYPNPANLYQDGDHTNLAEDGVVINFNQHDVTVADNFIHGYNCTTLSTCTSQQFTDGHHAYTYAIAAGIASTSSCVKGNTQILRNYIFHAATYGSIVNGCGDAGSVFQDNEIVGFDVEVSIEFMNGGYNTAGNLNTDGNNFFYWTHNYMHRNDQAWCQSPGNVPPPGTNSCHIDCFDNYGGPAVYMWLDRNVCFNMNQAVYIWDGCINQAETDSNSADCPQGTYTGAEYSQPLEYIYVTNNIFAFGAGNSSLYGGHVNFDVGMDFWHAGHIRWDNNVTWGTLNEVYANSSVDSFENNIVFQSYQGASTNCQFPYGVNQDVEWPLSDSSTYTTAQKNILYEDTTCTLSSGKYPSDFLNTNPVWVGPGTYSTIPGANTPNLTLQSASPAIAAGSDLCNWFTDDLAGNTRPCSAFDIGPYMFGSSSGSSSLSPPTDIVITLD